MGMSSSIKVAMELYKSGFFEKIDSVINMGSQELHVKYEDFKFWCEASGIEYEKNDFVDLANFPGFPRCSANKLWKCLGIKECQSMDYNGNYDSILHDLNYPYTNEEHIGAYDLVTDFGNNEHPFNVIEAYKTMHKLCKKDGYMWIDQAVVNGNGYFNFDIGFFEGMAAANSYSIVYSAFVVNTGGGRQYHIPCDKSILDLFDFNKLEYLGVSFIFKKQKDESFKYSYQSIGELDGSMFYRSQFLPNKYPPERYYLPCYISKIPTREVLYEAKKRIKEKFMRTIRRTK